MIILIWIGFRVNGLHCILITDREGVPLVRVVTERAPQLALRPTFISTFGMATDQASKLGLGRNKTIISMYSSYQVSRYRHIAQWNHMLRITLPIELVNNQISCIILLLQFSSVMCTILGSILSWSDYIKDLKLNNFSPCEISFKNTS